jgi:diguanylate cyclase (GGDEF)-like protein
MAEEAESGRQLANSMLGALLAVVHRVGGDDALTQVLAMSGEQRAAADIERPDGWSTYPQGLALFQAAADVLGDPDIGRKAGTEVFRRYAGTEVLALLRSIGSPGEMIRLYPSISAKQSTVTNAEVVEVGDDHGLIAVITPDIERNALFCGYTLGALSQFPVLFGMEPAQVEEVECQTRGDGRCLIRVSWDPTSSVEASLEAEVVLLRDQLAALTKRFESLEGVARELSSTRDVDSMLETITRRAGVAVRAPRYLLVARLPGDFAPRVHHVGFSPDEARIVAADLLTADLESFDGSRVVVEIRSARATYGRLAAFYPQQYRFLPQERSLLLAYAGHAAAALETAAALDEARDRNGTLSALLGLGRVLAEAITGGEVAQRLADALPEIVNSGQADVFLWEPGDARLVRAASTTSPAAASLTDTPVALRDVGLAARLLAVTTPLALDPTAEPVVSRLLALTGLPSGVLIPVAARHTLFGAIVVGPESDTLRTDSARERLSGVASLAATALEGVTLLEEVRHQALHDPITDLANSRLFEDRVGQALSIARRQGHQSALLFVDLDRFKSVNDTHGHKVGDELLRAVACRLQCSVRNEDTVARIGGDEFGILLQGVANREDAEVVAAKVVSTVEAPLVIGNLTLWSGASVGVTMFPAEHDTYDSVISRADSAMYQAKAKGRGQFHLYEPETVVVEGRRVTPPG